MGINSLLGKKPEFSWARAMEEFGLTAIARTVATIVAAKFELHPLLRWMQVKQFLREEADAMAQAGGYPAQIAERLFENRSEYAGALQEKPEYPVDFPGGPQQTLLKMTLDFIREAGPGSDLPARFRCEVVETLARWERTIFYLNTHPRDSTQRLAKHLHSELDPADELLGELAEKYHPYFSQFIPEKANPLMEAPF